jgi:hypothetical protein
VARYRIEAGVEIDSVSPAELRGELQSWDERRERQMVQDLRGIKPRRLPPMAGNVTAGGLIAIGGDTGQQPVGPTGGYTWFLRAIVVNGLATLAAGTGTSGEGTFTAGAGSAALPAGAAITGFTVSFSAAASTAGTITVTNVTGGPIVYDVPAGQAAPFVVNYPVPIPASGGPVTVTVAGLGTGAGAIEISGTSTGQNADLLDMQIFGSGSGVRWWQFGGGPGGAAPPYYTKWGMGEMWLEGGEYLAFTNAQTPAGVAVPLSAPVGTTIQVRGTIIQVPSEKVGRLFAR